MSAIFKIILQQIIRKTVVSYERKPNVPNEETSAAIEEGRKLAYDKNAESYTTIKDLQAALGV